MKLSRKISAILLILYYFAHIYAVNIQISPEEVKGLNHTAVYSSESGKLNFLTQLKLNSRHLTSSRVHQKFEGSKSIQPESYHRNTPGDQSSFIITPDKLVSCFSTVFESSLINKAPPIIYN